MKKIDRHPPVLEQSRSAHQEIMQMRKDRVSCKADGTHLFPLLYAITGTHQHAPRLHVYEQAILAVLVVDQREIADVFRVSTCWELGRSNRSCLRVFNPVVGNVIG